ncbi:MAG: dihydrolipoamide acetyltransferase family protein [Solirubrobacteraceae bacterium]
MSEIVMPRLSDTMEEGTILRWLKREGEHVSRGEELVEIETDKAAMVYESDQEGALRIVAQEGDTLAVGATIAHVGDAAEASVPASDALAHEDEGRVKASPLARRIAKQSGVDLHALAGSGPGGRIVKADVEAAERSPASTPASEEPSAPASLLERVASAKGDTIVVELTRTQQTIARRMAESKATIPDFALQAEIDMEQCVALRSELKRLSPEEAPTYNDMVVKACALALHEHPRANGSYRDGKLQLHSRVNVGVAVAADSDDPMGGALVVPTVFDAALKSLGEIARETRALAERVRAGTITPPELGGGTFTVSNLGMYGIRSFSAIVNPPQAAILSVGSLALRAVVLGGGAGGGDEIVARHTMAVTLVCDHRILYGADAARFLARIKALLEEPASLAL